MVSLPGSIDVIFKTFFAEKFSSNSAPGKLLQSFIDPFKNENFYKSTFRGLVFILLWFPPPNVRWFCKLIPYIVPRFVCIVRIT